MPRKIFQIIFENRLQNQFMRSNIYLQRAKGQQPKGVNMKITRKEVKINENMLNDMYAEKLLEKYYKSNFDTDGGIEEYLSLAVWVDKNTGLDYLYDIGRFDTYEECKQDDNANRVFVTRKDCYAIFITGKRVTFLKDKPIYVVIEAEAIER